MSHFPVLVVGQDVEQQLAPFQENNMGDCPREYMEFTDHEDDYRHDYDNEGAEMVVLEDGRLVFSWDEMFRQPGVFGKSEAPAHLERRQVMHKDFYPSFEDFVREWHGAEGRDEEKGRYGSWTNPNAKWDWYQLGGRWTGYFKLKDGAAGDTGSPGLLTRAAEAGHADSALKKDIDFDGMRAAAAAKALETYSRYEDILSKHGAAPDFAEFRDGFANIEDARVAYNNLESIQALYKAELMPWMSGIKEVYGMGREAFVAQARDSRISTYALLMNGKWYERGSMGWFGMASDEKDKDTWNKEFAKLLNSLPEDTLLSVVDCHI
jgi:hypothetical protein